MGVEYQDRTYCTDCGIVLRHCNCPDRETEPPELNFGDYCSVEQKRYGAPNEHYQYKVIGRLRSNVYIPVPVDAQDGRNEMRNQGEVVPVIECVNAAVGQHKIVRFRTCDVAPWGQKAGINGN